MAFFFNVFAKQSKVMNVRVIYVGFTQKKKPFPMEINSMRNGLYFNVKPKSSRAVARSSFLSFGLFKKEGILHFYKIPTWY
jgi:hypothetical protein